MLLNPYLIRRYVHTIGALECLLAQKSNDLIFNCESVHTQRNTHKKIISFIKKRRSFNDGVFVS